MDEKLVKIKDLVEYYGISRQTIERWRKEGLPCRKVGFSVRYNFNEVEQWIKENKSN